MSIQYAGGAIVSAALTQSAGTRAELSQWIRDQLVLAGWESTGVATDYQLTSATTGQSLACRVRSYDPGSGNCARLRWSNPGGTRVQAGDMFLVPGVGKAWRMIANRYQFFVFTPGGSLAREFACGGVPYLPAFLSGSVTEAIWAHGNAANDADTSNGRPGFRTKLHQNGAGSGANSFQLINGTAWEVSGTGAGGVGSQRLVLPAGAKMEASNSGYRWHDDTVQVCEPLIGWGASAATDEAKIRGQLWDAAIVGDAFASDASVSLDSRTFWAITNGAAYSAAEPLGTLFVAVT